MATSFVIEQYWSCSSYFFSWNSEYWVKERWKIYIVICIIIEMREKNLYNKATDWYKTSTGLKKTRDMKEKQRKKIMMRNDESLLRLLSFVNSSSMYPALYKEWIRNRVLMVIGNTERVNGKQEMSQFNFCRRCRTWNLRSTKCRVKQNHSVRLTRRTHDQHEIRIVRRLLKRICRKKETDETNSEWYFCYFSINKRWHHINKYDRVKGSKKKRNSDL